MIELEDRLYTKQEVEEIANLSYTGGYFDGEGCVFSQMYENGSIALRVAISNTYKRALTRMQQVFGGSIRTMKVRDGNKPAWEWRACGMECYSFLQKITPYLEDKRSQAEYALAVSKHLLSRRYQRLSEKDKQTFMRYHLELKAMKRDIDRLGRDPTSHRLDKPESTLVADTDILSWTLGDQHGGRMVTGNPGL